MTEQLFQASTFVSKLENNSGRHTEQPFKNRYKLKSQNNGNEFRPNASLATL